MKKLGHIESLSLYLPIEPPLHAIHPPSFTWRLVSTLNQWEQKGKKQKEQKFSTHVYTYGTAKRVSMSALRRVLYGDWEFGYDFWQKSLPAWNWLKVLITAFTMARVRYLWQNCPCKEVTMQEYHTYLVPILHYIIFKNIRLEQFSTVSIPFHKVPVLRRSCEIALNTEKA